MTGRVTFGDFVRAARIQLTAGPAGLAGGLRPAERTEQVHRFIGSMSRIVAVMEHYASDIEAVLVPPPKGRRQRPRGAWPRASIEVHDAIQNAAGYLTLAQGAAAHLPERHAADLAEGGLDAAVVSLSAARDLLHSHFAVQPDRTRVDRSEWSPVISSASVARTLLLQLGVWTRMAAAQGARVAVSGPPWRGAGDERRYLNDACQWLWVLDSAVRSAQRLEPLSIADVELLNAIPASEPAPRHLPSGAETVAELCEGATLSAERVRHATYVATPDAVFSPALTAISLSQTAASATVISHHCDLLLRALADRAAQQRTPDISARLLACAAAAANARRYWLRAARLWYRITTDTREGTTPAAAEMADLALWTGRLAYSDPAWTPALGPSEATRASESLVPEPADLGGVLAAVHQACETLTRIAATDHDQISMAAQAGRLLVPTRSLPATYDIPQPFAPAPADRVNGLLAAYQEAQAASIQATAAAVEAVAAKLGAPSHLLTLARAATHADPTATVDRWQPAGAAAVTRDFPGPVERVLHDLGVTSPDIISRAVALDQASELLILDAAHAAEPRHPDSEAMGWTRSAAAAELINYALASGNSRAVARLHPAELQVTRSLGTDPYHVAGRLTRHVVHDPRSALELQAEP